MERAGAFFIFKGWAAIMLHLNLFLAVSFLCRRQLGLSPLIRLVVLSLRVFGTVSFVIKLTSSEANNCNLCVAFLRLLLLLSLLPLHSLALRALKGGSLLNFVLLQFNYCKFVLQLRWACISWNHLGLEVLDCPKLYVLFSLDLPRLDLLLFLKFVKFDLTCPDKLLLVQLAHLQLRVDNCVLIKAALISGTARAPSLGFFILGKIVNHVVDVTHFVVVLRASRDRWMIVVLTADYLRLGRRRLAFTSIGEVVYLTCTHNFPSGNKNALRAICI